MKNQNVSVYEILRDKIINLDFKPGQEIDVNSLAEELEVSRSPIRDALLRLEIDKLVDIFPQKGTRVSFLDKEIIMQERFLRTTMEIAVLKIFMENLKDESKREVYETKLYSIIFQQRANLLDRNKKLFLQNDDELHRFFYTETGNQWLWNVVKSHTGNDHRIRILSYNAQQIADAVENEHRQLVTAVHSGDVENAILIDKNHLSRLPKILDALEKIYPEYFEKK